MKKYAVIYTRVSTDEQAEKGHSLPFQLEECRAYANRLGFHVIREIVDNTSGATLDRPGFTQLESMLANREAQVVIAYTSDRISRNYYDYVPLIGKWQDKNIELHFVDRGQSHNDLQGMISDGIFAMLAHTERLKILDRTKNGRLKKAKDDKKPVMTGQVPYGYGRIGKSRDAEMIIDSFESEIVKLIFRWYTTHEDGGPLSLMAIAKRLDEMGIKPRSSNVWQPNSIRMILINETYAGLNYYAKTQIPKDGRQVPRPKEEWIPIDVPHLALVDRATFDAAQVRARRNQEFAKRNRKHEYLLVGHIRCASCKLAMYGFRKWDGAVPYYRCASYNNKIAVCWHRKRSVKMGKADEAVWKWLTSLLMDEEALLAGVHDMSEKREEELEPKRERYGYVVKILNTTSEKIQRMVDELADFEGETVKIAIKEKIRQLESEQKLLFEEKEKLEEDLAALEISPNLENRILEISANVRGNLPAATFEDMRDLLELFQVKVQFHDLGDQIKLHVSCELPNSEEDIVLSSS